MKTGFQLEEKDKSSNARAGSFTTAHGAFQTPIFMPVGTQGTIKAAGSKEISEQAKAQIVLSNTYHLYLRPGMDVMKSAGGLHKFMAWDKPILTDSGGYQVFSLAQRRKIKEEGAEFQSHIDGSKHLFSPEFVVDIQRTIGSDIMMAFDECPPFPSTYDYAKESLQLTNRWLDRCIEQFNKTEGNSEFIQHLFPIVQGSTYEDLRKESCEYVASKDLPGNAIGGLSVGEPEEELYRFTDLCCATLPYEKPRYLMGVGTPANLLECIGMGVDMFDCVMPSRNARHGLLFTMDGIINIKNKKWESDFTAIDPAGYCDSDLRYSKAYLRHLIISNEILGLQIATLHNLAFYLQLVSEARKRILEGNFAEWKNKVMPGLKNKL